MKTVVVIDDHKGMREAISEIIGKLPDFRLLFSAANGYDFLCKLNEIKDQPLFVMSDILMPIMDGIAIISFLKRHHPSIKCIAISNFCNSQLVQDVMKAGAHGFILKDKLVPDKFNRIFNCCENNEFYFDESITKEDIPLQFDYSKLSSFLEIGLTNKEILYLELSATGISYDQMASIMNVSPTTIYNYQKSLKEKTGLSSRHELTIFAFQNGIAAVARVKSIS